MEASCIDPAPQIPASKFLLPQILHFTPTMFSDPVYVIGSQEPHYPPPALNLTPAHQFLARDPNSQIPSQSRTSLLNPHL